MRNVSQISIGNQTIYILLNGLFSRKLYLLRNNKEKYGRAFRATEGNIMRLIRFTCWVTKATNTYSDHVILIAFPRQQWLRERHSVLLVKFIECLI